MKKLLAMLLVLTMVMSLVACASSSQNTTEEPAETTTEAAAEPAASEGEVPVIKIGVLSMLNLSEKEMIGYYNAVGLATAALVEANKAKYAIDVPSIETKMKGAGKDEIIFYDSLDAMLMALNAGEINMISIYNTTADYLVANDDQLVKGIEYEYNPDASEDYYEDFFNALINPGLLNNSFAFMMMEKNEALRDEFNTAIASMREDGTLDTLIKEQMQEVVKSGEAKPVEMPVIEGAETIKVAVTGSLPPMDYVAADGTPAGYNTAVLAEISKRIGKNIEIVVVDSVGRAAALSSGTADVVFWVRGNDMSNEIASKSEEEDTKSKEEHMSILSEVEKELMNKIDEIIDFGTLGQNDQPEGTIITESYFRDSLVPVTTKKQLELMKNEVK